MHRLDGDVHDIPRAQTSSALPAASPEWAHAQCGAMSITELMDATARLQGTGDTEQAAALYQCWIEHTDSPHLAVAYFNMGTLLGALKRPADAQTAYRKALKLRSDFAQARLNLGHQLENQGDLEGALAQWRQVWEHGNAGGQPFEAEIRLHAVNNLARSLEVARRLNEAEAYMVESLTLDPKQSNVLQHYVHIRQKQCEWPVYKTFGAVTKNALLMGTSALATLSASDDPALQLLAAHRFVKDKYADSTVGPLYSANRPKNERIRIAYLSGDFCLHAMGLLIPELLELHDRERFEIFGLCWSREDGTPQRARLIDAMDHHIRIHELDDLNAAKLIAQLNIDVLIDLHGLSSGARPEILAHRPAPVQIGYLGLPATSALPGVDYMIADRYVMPESSLAYYTEKPLYMPHSYQVCDRQRPVAEAPTRADYDLPDNAFVYCSFNNNHKFSEPVFNTWMQVLQSVPDSVLWLLADNEWAKENMLACADRHQVSRDRLIFAPRVAPPEYLARFALADLFLDTFPYNAGATASDVLWMGTPILTRSGKTYISRMAGSLLTSVGLPDLITDTIDEYRDLAITIGQNPDRAKSYKRYLAEHGHASKLFDVPALVSDLENGFVGLLNDCSTTSEDTTERSPV